MSDVVSTYVIHGCKSAVQVLQLITVCRETVIKMFSEMQRRVVWYVGYIRAFQSNLLPQAQVLYICNGFHHQ